MTTKPMSLKLALIGCAASILMSAGSAFAASDAPEIERQTWTFAGFTGQFERNQLQRGFQIYKGVCAACHGIKRVAFRNLAEPGGPQFPEDAVKALAAEYQIDDGPDDEGKMFKRPGRPADRFPSPYANDNEARAANNSALPPDLSVIARARNVESHAPWYIHPFLMLKDVAIGYQEGGADYIYALMTGYTSTPSDMKMAEGMNYNAAFPGHQIAMVAPLSDGAVPYTDGTPQTLDNYARDVAAFLSWTADPHHDKRKRLGWQVMFYLLITALLFFIAKRRIWAGVKH